MPKEIKSYQCETCKKIYPSVERAERCEESHIHPVDILEELFHFGEIEPRVLMVKMSDGSVIQYDMHMSVFIDWRNGND